MVGSCKFGENCQFKHESSLGVKQEPKGKQLGGKQTTQSIFNVFANTNTPNKGALGAAGPYSTASTFLGQNASQSKP